MEIVWGAIYIAMLAAPIILIVWFVVAIVHDIRHPRKDRLREYTSGNILKKQNQP